MYVHVVTSVSLEHRFVFLGVLATNNGFPFVFRHTWEQITMAAWQKYPNPMNPNVVGTDVLERHVDDRGVLHSHRLLTTAKWSVPRFVTSVIEKECTDVVTPPHLFVLQFLGIDEYCHVYEYSTVDPKSKLMTLRSVNVCAWLFLCVHAVWNYVSKSVEN